MSETEQKPIHEGHRKRVKAQLIAGNFGETTPLHVLLETLLFFSIPRKDTNPIAHELLNKFGSLDGVLSAPREQLLKINGVTDNTVALLRLIAPLMRAVNNESLSGIYTLRTHGEMCEYVMRKFAGFNKEKVALLCLKSSGKIISFDFIADGDISSVGVSVRSIMERVITGGATAVALAHNHPSGVALPSPIDIEVTKGIANSLRQVGVLLIDHIIVCKDDYVSMAQSSEYGSIF